MLVRRWIVFIAIAVSLALAVGGCSGYGYGTTWYSDLDNHHYYDDNPYYDEYLYSDCPRHWIFSPLDCRDCHNFY